MGGDQHVKLGGSHLVEAAQDIHFKAATSIVIEAPDLTFKSDGGFISHRRERGHHQGHAL